MVKTIIVRSGVEEALQQCIAPLLLARLKTVNAKKKAFTINMQFPVFFIK